MPKKTEKNPLEDAPFDFRKYKNGNVSVFWNNKEVTVLKGGNAQKFLAETVGKSEYERQLLMAKITGNFKRGNERQGKQKAR